MKAEQLRKSILQLAIQGKLVKQDPNDEPASVLLERIREEKQRLIKEGKIKKDKGDSIIFKGDDNCHYEKVGSEVKNIEDEIDFELPDGWEYIKLSQIAYLGSGFTPSPSELSTNGNIPYFKVSDMNTIGNEKYISITQQYYIGDKTKKVFPKHTIIFPKNGGAVFTNKKRILSQDSIVDLNTGAFIPYGLIDVEYAYILFSTIDFREHHKGTALPTINTEFMDKLIFGLPPIAEQKRIVKAIEKLSPYIQEYDNLERQATKLDKEIYDKLKKSILQYAIQGKLVEQDENDEPASVLLERIRAEKKAQLGKKYVESYIYKGDDNCYYEKNGSAIKNITDEIPFDIPENWCWTRLNDICDYIHRGKSPTYGSSKILPIMAQKCNQWDKIYTDRCLFAEEKSIERYTDEQFLKLGDIIINSTGTGTVGRTGMIENYVFEKYSKFVADSHVTVVRVNSNLIPKYLYLFLISPQIQVDVESKCSGSTNQIELGTNTIKNYLIPLPPINEQQRIVRVYNKILYKIKDEI